MSDNHPSRPINDLSSLEALLAQCEDQLQDRLEERIREEEERQRRQEEERQRAEAARRQELTDAWYERHAILERISTSLEQAHELQDLQIVGRLSPARDQVEEEMSRIEVELGYDPEERRQEELDRQRRERVARRDEVYNRLSRSIREIDSTAALNSAIREATAKWPILLPSQIEALLAQAMNRAEGYGYECSEAATGLIASFRKDFGDLVGADDEEEQTADRRAERTRWQRTVTYYTERIRELRQQVIDLETIAFAAASGEVRARIGIIGAEARIIQEELNERRLPASLAEDLGSVFRSLTHISKEARPGSVPLLHRDYRGDFHEMKERYLQDLARALEEPLPEEEEAPRPIVTRSEEHRKESLDALQELRGHYEDPYFPEDLEGQRQAARLVGRAAIGLDDDHEGLVAACRRILERVPSFFDDYHNSVLGRLRPTLGLAAPSVAGAATDGNAAQIHGPEAAYRDRFSGRHGLIVGGVPRESARQSIESLLGFISLEWIEIGKRNAHKVRSLVERVSRGSYDAVFVLVQFIGHTPGRDIRAAAESAGVSCYLVTGGYGVTAITNAVASQAGGGPSHSEELAAE